MTDDRMRNIFEKFREKTEAENAVLAEQQRQLAEGQKQKDRARQLWPARQEAIIGTIAQVNDELAGSGVALTCAKERGTPPQLGEIRIGIHPVPRGNPTLHFYATAVGPIQWMILASSVNGRDAGGKLDQDELTTSVVRDILLQFLEAIS